jgi:heme exporter protein A
MHLLSVEAITKQWGETPLFTDVSFGMAAGERIGVIGTNGAGKSTLLRIIAGLLRPHGGEVSVLGAALPRDAAALRGRVGYVGHEPLLYRDLTGRENLHFHARLHGIARGRVEELLDATGMGSRGDQPVAELSKGLRQRLAVARAGIADPPLLLLDEPRAHLDPAAADLLEPLVGRSAARTRLLVTHDLEAALAESEVVLGLRAGRTSVLERADRLDAASLRAALFG